ncbi:MAG: MBL fold metallo-hydrolase [Clostridia bacterium]|nr:MBL fold metallo-hydrolase [Clostridia bacterium]
MLTGIQCLGHSTIKINKNSKIMYIDPFNIEEENNDADIIFVTHNHYDHYSPKDIDKIKKEDTIIVITNDLYNEAKQSGFKESKIVTVKPNQTFNVSNIIVTTVPAYNINKKFHPKENEWVGYILNIENIKYYIAGDTDITDENRKVECDVAFVPVGGTYTMTSKEAAELVNEIMPNIAIPIHYGSIVGTKQDAIDFKEKLDERIRCEILIK